MNATRPPQHTPERVAATYAKISRRILPLLFVLLASYGFMQGNTMAGALNVDPRRAGSVSALMGGASFGVGALAASLSGAFHDGTPRPMAVLPQVPTISRRPVRAAIRSSWRPKFM